MVDSVIVGVDVGVGVGVGVVAAPFRCRSLVLSLPGELPRACLTPFSGAIAPTSPLVLLTSCDSSHRCLTPPRRDETILVPRHPLERQAHGCEFQTADDEDAEGFEEHGCILKCRLLTWVGRCVVVKRSR